MRQYLTALVILVAAPAAADEWRLLRGDEIRDVLTERTVDYPSAWQDFRAKGLTLYNAGADSWGTWDVRNDRYCSQWPPNSAWVCFDVDLNGDGSAVRFRGTGNDITIGRFRGSK